MSGARLKILILSVLLLTLSSGLLFYQNLFHFETKGPGGKIDFDELLHTEEQVKVAAMVMRSNLNTDSNQLDSRINRTKELLNIVTDVNKNSPELRKSILKIQDYFDRKIIDINHFKTSLAGLKKTIEALTPIYNELGRNKIKFSVDNKDFYRECIIDALYYVLLPSKESEVRLLEDKKILSQILSFANTPNPIVQKFDSHIDDLLKITKEINVLTENINKDFSINDELKTIEKYYKEFQNERSRDGEIFLFIIFGAIVLYLISLIALMRKLT